MKILMHDFGGHAFTAELSRELAHRGHEVSHVFSSSFYGPKGTNEWKEGDSPTLKFHPIDLGGKMEITSLFKRRKVDLEHGKIVAELVAKLRPDVVLSGNGNLDTQKPLIDVCQASGIPFVFWLQDIVGVAGRRILVKKLPVAGHFVANYYHNLEQKLLNQSDWIVAIADVFLPHISANHAKVSVIENWAALNEISVEPRRNNWGERHGLHETKNIVYSGTLGLKHNPELLVQLALATAEDPEVRVVVCSGARGFKYLEERKAALGGLPNLVLLPFQDFSDVPLVFGTADIVVALLEPDAGIFSVPSKVLAYFCAGRPILMAVPPENLSAKNVLRIGAGVVVPPDQTEEFVRQAKLLLADPSRREEMGRKGRAYAEETFDIATIGDKFMAIFENLQTQRAGKGNKTA